MESNMKIAVPLTQGRLSPHFGHAEAFAIVEADREGRRVLGMELHSPPAHEPGALPRWLAGLGVEVILAGGMGTRAQQFFAQFGIEVIVGLPAEAPERLVQGLLDGTLESGQNVCDH